MKKSFFYVAALMLGLAFTATSCSNDDNEDYKGVPGLRVGASFYYCADAGSNSDKLDSYSSKVPLRIFTADAQYRNKYVIARGNIVYGNLGNSTGVSKVNI